MTTLYAAFAASAYTGSPMLSFRSTRTTPSTTTSTSSPPVRTQPASATDCQRRRDSAIPATSRTTDATVTPTTALLTSSMTSHTVLTPDRRSTTKRSVSALGSWAARSGATRFSAPLIAGVAPRQVQHDPLGVTVHEHAVGRRQRRPEDRVELAALHHLRHDRREERLGDPQIRPGGLRELLDQHLRERRLHVGLVDDVRRRAREVAAAQEAPLEPPSQAGDDEAERRDDDEHRRADPPGAIACVHGSPLSGVDGDAKARVPTRRVGGARAAGRDPVAVAIRGMAEIRAAPDDLDVSFRRPGRVDARASRVAWKSTSNQSAHHSHTFPAGLWRPNPLGANASTGAVPR